MKFEVVNDKNKTVMCTTDVSCIPDKIELNSISKAGYKFKVDGKAVSAKKLNERLKELSNDENNQN